MKDFNAEALLVQGKRGLFDVVVDDSIVFSKYDTGRFPRTGEITTLLKER